MAFASIRPARAFWIVLFALSSASLACGHDEKPIVLHADERDMAAVEERDAAAADDDAGGEQHVNRHDSLGNGGGAKLGKLDPDHVYLLGALDAMSRRPGALAQLEHIDVTQLAPMDMRLPTVRRSDGRVVYNGWTEVQADGGPSVMRNALFASMGTAEEMDRKAIPTPACDDTPMGVRMFHLHPETDEIIYSCADPDFCKGIFGSSGDAWSWLSPVGCSGGPWFDQQGNQVGPFRWLLTVGYGDSLLLGNDLNTNDLALYDRKTMEITPVEVPPERAQDYNGEPLAVRALPDGYWLVFRGSDNTLYRWHIAPDGKVVEEGKYSALPKGVTRSIVFYGDTAMDAVAMDAKGALYQSAWTQTPNNDKAIDVVVKRVLVPGESTIAYTENDSPWITGGQDNGFLYAVPDSFLFTGP